MKQDYYCILTKINLKEFELYKYYFNNSTNLSEWEKIENVKQINFKDTYVFPFGYWCNQASKYIKIKKENKIYWKLEPIPKNNEIFFIDSQGIITKEEEGIFHKYDNFNLPFFSKVKYPLFGICDNQWYRI